MVPINGQNQAIPVQNTILRISFEGDSSSSIPQIALSEEYIC